VSTFESELAAHYGQLRDVLHRVAASVLREVGLQDDAPDVVLAAIESLLERPPTEPIKNWEAYLVRVTKNKAYDRIRAADVIHFGRSLDMEVDDRPDLEEQSIAEVEDRIDADRNGALVWDALSTLDERERRIVRAVVQGGRTQDDVAAELGITRARVSQIRTGALRKLREELKSGGVQR